MAYFLARQEKLFSQKVKGLIDNRLNNYAQQEERNQDELVELKFKEWRYENEFDIRRTAIKRANTSILDSISSEVDIVKENFSFNPRDVKFIGRFIDLVIFDGAALEEEVSIYFVNIVRKENETMTRYKRLVEGAIKNKKVTFKEKNL